MSYSCSGARLIEIVKIVLGPVQTNTYLVADTEAQQAVVIDPAWDGQEIVKVVKNRGWRLQAIWLTHAHFDHFAGVAGLLRAWDQEIPVALHSADLPLWRTHGGAGYFGLKIEPGPEPTIALETMQQLIIGSIIFQVIYAPGHTLGHVVFHCPAEKVVFCGDVIFRSAIGRTDLPGGSYTMLIKSIREQILTLPDDTRLLSGHGVETTVGLERVENPFF